jgi:hypothetical protein
MVERVNADQGVVAGRRDVASDCSHFEPPGSAGLADAPRPPQPFQKIMWEPGGKNLIQRKDEDGLM